MKSVHIKLIAAAGVILLGLIAVLMMFDVVTIRGNQVGVKEDWWSGVLPDPLPPKTYFVWPWQRVQEYPTSIQVFVMNDKTPNEGEVNKGRHQDS